MSGSVTDACIALLRSRRSDFDLALPVAPSAAFDPSLAAVLVDLLLENQSTYGKYLAAKQSGSLALAQEIAGKYSASWLPPSLRTTANRVFFGAHGRVVGLSFIGLPGSLERFAEQGGIAEFNDLELSAINLILAPDQIFAQTRAIAAVLPQLHTLKHLSISFTDTFNLIDAADFLRGYQEFIGTISRLRGLQILETSNLPMRNAELVVLAKGLTQLRQLSVEHNHNLWETQLLPSMSELRRFSSLEEIEYRYSPLFDWIASVSQCEGIKKAFLVHPWRARVGETPILDNLELLKRLKKLSHLEVISTHYDDVQAAQIAAFVAQFR